VDPLELHACPGDHPELTEGADHGSEEILVTFWVHGVQLALGVHQVELQAVLTEGAAPPVVLAVHVHAQGAPDGGVHGPGDDGRPPPVTEGEAPQLAHGAMATPFRRATSRAWATPAVVEGR